MLRLIWVLPIVLAAAAVSGGGAVSPTAGSPNRNIRVAPLAGLSAGGRVLWNLEGLLYKTFGARVIPCVANERQRTFYDFQARTCSPLAAYRPYFYVFAPHRETTFHVSAKSGRGMNFGNYPVPIRIHRHLVACDTIDKTFVIEYLDSINFSLACEAPNR
jgi:hypothetical protein